MLVQQAWKCWWDFGKLTLALPCLFPLLWSFAFGALLCGPSMCAFGSIDVFGFVFFVLVNAIFGPWHFGPLGLVIWSGGHAGTFGKVSARAEGERLTEEMLVSVPA